ncbi:4-hydroxy-tetrahydrodipicolinate synthase [Hydrogenispora ethanolica]|uniref:4-hydroxy-tetrahydrodipicolinate synthase n=1 Tax=Hydrogenispora ethanolica TaxID=1082276 RepID=A0A4R1R8C5_HYDET|nr:4-hydroxy-tetrahydrodipicolinate synthase [Hydrogenispora ethanolica]TCL61799.1 4-hydroxy-tetrahydrodipicolinate synthase [Hydrogenispora ethanolica]
MVKLGKLLTAMVTPFDQDLQVNYAAAQDLATRLLDSGSDGLVVAGTTGESPTLTKQEKLQLFRAVVEAVGSKGTVIAGTGSYDTAESIELTKEAEKTGVDGVLLVAPYYNKPPQEGLYRHFKAIAQATSLPAIVYNIPSRTNVNVSVETMVRLAEIPNIVGIKESTGNLAQASELFEKTPSDFLIYSGDDSLTLPLLSVGGVGVISVAAHLVGRKIQAMISAYLHGDVSVAARINAELGPLNRALFINTNPIMVKSACNLLGFRTGGLRLPLVEASPKELEILREVLRDLGLL